MTSLFLDFRALDLGLFSDMDGGRVRPAVSRRCVKITGFAALRVPKRTLMIRQSIEVSQGVRCF